MKQIGISKAVWIELKRIKDSNNMKNFNETIKKILLLAKSNQK